MNAPVPAKLPVPGDYHARAAEDRTDQTTDQRPDQKSDHKRRHASYAAEATGLLLMALLLLALTLIRYWRHIPWSAR